MKDKLLFFLALFSSKFYLFILKIIHKEQDDKPGLLALKIYDNFLEIVKKPELVICVTGTNGKTTVTNMLAEMLIKLGNKVSYNNWGANTRAGATRCMLDSVTLFNKSRVDAVVIEVDEITSKDMLPYLLPNYLIVTNLYRDSMHRNAHPYFVFDKINDYIPKKTTLILNADDPISSMLGENNKRVYLGIDKLDSDTSKSNNIINDFALCPNCNSEIEYIFSRFHHIGKVKCPNCDFKSKEADYLATNIDLKNKYMVVTNNNKENTYMLASNDISNAYNMLDVIACLRTMNIDNEKIQTNLKDQTIVASRYTSSIINNIEINTIIAKGMNAVATSRVCDYISKLQGNIEIIIVIDDQFDNKNGSEAIAWIYDTDFELLNKNNIKKIIIGGVRNRDYVLRLLLAGIDKDKLVGVQKEEDTYQYLNYDNIDKILILHDCYYVSGAFKIKDNIIKQITERNNK